MSSNMMNIKGTMLPSFKIRPNGGIELISAAIKSGDKYELGQFKVKLADNSIHDVAYYDTVIGSENISSMKYETKVNAQGISSDYLTLVLRTGISITLPLRVNSSDLTLPSDAEDNEIAIYGKNADGTVYLKKSGYFYGDSNGPKKDLESLGDNDIVTAATVKTYVDKNIGSASETLSERLNGNNVTEQI